MPIDTIGQLQGDVAELEARGIERGSQELRGLAGGIGGSMRGALESAEVLQKNELDKQKQKEMEELLATGEQGIAQYAQERGIKDPSSFLKMAQFAKQSKDPKALMNIYGLVKQTGDKQDADARRSEGVAAFSGSLNSLKSKIDTGTATTKDFDSTLLNLEELSAASIGDKELTAQYNKAKDEVRALKKESKVKGVDKIKDIADKLKVTRDEAKHFDNRIKESKIIRDKATGVMLAVNRAVEDVQSGKDPNNLTLDQVLGVSLQKVLDPPSVVRESEFDRLKMGQAFFAMLKGKLEALSSGGSGLTDESRARTTQFVKDMAQLAERNIRKEMLTVGVRSGFGEIYNPQEIDATMFSPEEVAKMKDIHDGKTKAEDEMVDDRIKSNVKWFLANPNILSEKAKRPKEAGGGSETTAPPVKKVDASMNVQDMLSTLPKRGQ